MSVQAMSWVFEHSRASLGARLVLLAIANHADRDGRNSWASVGTLALEAHLSDRQVRRALRELEVSGEIVEVAVSPQRTHVYEIAAMATLFGEGDNMSAPPDNLSAVNMSPGQIVPTRGTNRPVEGDRMSAEPRTNRPKNRPFSINRSFDEFWEAYPRKVGKPKAVLAYKRALKLGTSEAILDGARRYRDDPNREDRYTAHPTTWLARAGWDDPAIPAPSPSGRREEPPSPYAAEAEYRAFMEDYRAKQP